MIDMNVTHDADLTEPNMAKQIDRDDCGDTWADWDDIGGEG
jgi:hypothetical protein